MSGPSGATQAGCAHLRMCDQWLGNMFSVIRALPLYMYRLETLSEALMGQGQLLAKRC